MTHFLAFGDSITYGAGDPQGSWVERLREAINKRQDVHRVYNLGISGDTSAGMLERFSLETAPRIADDEPNVILLAIGTNDAAIIDKKHHWVEKGEFGKNINTIIKLAKRITPHVFVVNLLPVDEEKVRPVPWRPDIEYTNESIAHYNTLLHANAEKEQVTLIDVHSVFSKKKYAALFVDGLHPNAKGYALLFETVIATLKKEKLV